LRTLYKTIAEVEIVGEFVENRKLSFDDFQQGLVKVEEAINKVPQIEVKETLDFDKEKMWKKYKEIVKYAPQTDKEFRQYAKRKKEIDLLNSAKHTDYLIDMDKMNPRPLTKSLNGVRAYNEYATENILKPYDYIYGELFSNLLRKADVKLPGYDEIFVSIAETMVQAKNTVALEEWYKYTYSTINVETYEQADDKEKANMVFESICEGLRLIADFDHLEKDKIESVIEYIDKNGMDIELTYCVKESKHYRVEIVYHVPKVFRAMAEFYVRVTNLHTHESRTILIDKFPVDDAPYIIGKVQVKKYEIVIIGRTSVAAECTRSRYKLPSEYRFTYEEVFSTEA
jgi:hypothetical protein